MKKIILLGMIVLQLLTTGCGLTEILTPSIREGRPAAVAGLKACGLDTGMIFEGTASDNEWRDRSASTVYYLFVDMGEHKGKAYSVEVITQGRTHDSHVGVGWEGYENMTKFDYNVCVVAGTLDSTSCLLHCFTPARTDVTHVFLDEDHHGTEEYYFNYDWQTGQMEFVGYNRHAHGRSMIESYYRDWQEPCIIDDRETPLWTPSEFGFGERFVRN